MTTAPQYPDVIVVGAGAAGFAAADALQAVGLNALVLEAAGHAGGRCVTDTSKFSMPFDRGGSWLHSGPINPLAKLANQRGAKLHKAPWTWSRIQVDGYDMSADEVEVFTDYQDDVWESINQRGLVEPDIATRDCIPDGRWLNTAACAIPQMLGGDADVTSARDTSNYAYAEGDWLVEGGLGAFMQDVHRHVPVKLNCPVSKIDYTGQGVRVTTPDGVLQARYLVLTVSTGVLAAEGIAFDPPLPPEKTTAVDILPNGLLNKIGIEFDPAWKEATQGQMADYHSADDAFCSVLFGFFGTSLAVGFVAGRFAAALEQEGEGAAREFCLKGLREIFGSDITKSIRKVDETMWLSDPLTRGSYSYAKPGGTGARQHLAEPLADRVFFAGEATMTNTYSTVHGAWLSGQRAADQIATLARTTPTRSTAKQPSFG